MHFTSIESVGAAWAAMPQVVDHLISLSNVVFVAAGVIGLAILVLRDHWFGSLLLVLGVVNVYFYANYLGDLSHYLLTTWLILAIGVGVAAEWVVRVLARRIGPAARRSSTRLLALPLVLLAGNWAAHDQSANRDGERFTAEVFAALPQDAVLITYWDALTPMSYEHCIEGVRPDVSLRAYDEKALVTCDPLERPLIDVARRRPVYALMVLDQSLGPDPDAGALHGVPVEMLDQLVPSGAGATRISIGCSTGWSRPTRRPEVDAGYALLDFGGGARGSSASERGSRIARTRAALGSREAPDAWRDGRPSLRPRPRLDRHADPSVVSRGRSRWTG